MTVGELIKLLQQEVESRIVLIDGYETGFDTPIDLVVYSVRKRPDADRLAQHDGHYELHDDEEEGGSWAVAIRTRRG